MSEITIVRAVVAALENRGFRVTTEVANFHRSADIGVVDDDGNVWVIECKVSNMSKAIAQARTHKLAADRVFIATFHRRTRATTLERIKAAGVGLLYVMPDGSLNEPVEAPRENRPWGLARGQLLKRIVEAR